MAGSYGLSQKCNILRCMDLVRSQLKPTWFAAWALGTWDRTPLTPRWLEFRHSRELGRTSQAAKKGWAILTGKETIYERTRNDLNPDLFRAASRDFLDRS